MRSPLQLPVGMDDAGAGTVVPTRRDSWAERRVLGLLAAADIAVDGGRPWDISVHNNRFYRRVVYDGIVGLGDAWIDGWWDCRALDQFFERALRADLPGRIGFDRRAIWSGVKHRLLNLQGRRSAKRCIAAHYHLGNDVFEATLDRRMLYTCGYWKNARTLDEAQEAKLDLICRKIGLRAGQRVLDIGCGWGSFGKYAAERYGAGSVGITISTEQVDLARSNCRGLDVEIRLQDYRDVDERFDHVVCVGCIEHVGPKNYQRFMRAVHRCLSDGGLFLLHTIGSPVSFLNARRGEIAWINRHIFPGGVVPSMKQLGAAIEGLLVIEDVHNFGADYDPTLMAWFENFDRNWPGLAEKHGERFYRMWKFYLLMCAGAFRARRYHLWQIVMSKNGVRGGYRAVR